MSTARGRVAALLAARRGEQRDHAQSVEAPPAPMEAPPAPPTAAPLPTRETATKEDLAAIRQMRSTYEPCKIDASCLPACVYETGMLTRGLPVWSCPKCTLFYNSAEGVTEPTCARCGLAPRTREQLPIEYQQLFKLLDEAEAAGSAAPLDPLPQPISMD